MNEISQITTPTESEVLLDIYCTTGDLLSTEEPFDRIRQCLFTLKEGFDIEALTTRLAGKAVLGIANKHREFIIRLRLIIPARKENADEPHRPG